MTARGELYDLLHRQAWVTVLNPWVRSQWTGRMVAIHDDPGLIIEQADGVRICLPQEFTVEETPAPPGGVTDRYAAGRADALREFAADLDADAAATATLSNVGEKPWPSMLGARVDDAQTAVAILRRDAQLARNRADAPPVRPNVPATAACPPVAVAGAPDPAERHP